MGSKKAGRPLYHPGKTSKIEMKKGVIYQMFDLGDMVLRLVTEVKGIYEIE